MQDLLKHTDNINKLLARFGVKFGIYKNNVFHEQLFPFDAIPRVITAAEFAEIEKGLVQRVTALNMFLYDIYHDQHIIKDKVIPEDFVFPPKAICRNVMAAPHPKRFIRIFPALILYRLKTKPGIFWRITCVSLQVPPIR